MSVYLLSVIFLIIMKRDEQAIIVREKIFAKPRGETHL